MEIKLYATLRDVAGSKSIFLDSMAETTVGEMLEALFVKSPALQAKLLNREGDLNPSFQILVNGRNIQYIDGLQTVVTADDEVRIFPPVGGGV